MKLTGIVAAVAFSCQILNAQNPGCSDAEILAIRGTWEKSDYVNSFYDPQNSSSFNEARLIVAKIAGVFQELLPDPAGVEPKWWGSERDAISPDGPLAYDFESDYLKYFCSENAGELLLGVETGTWIHVHVNSGGYVFQPYDTLVIDGKEEQVYQLPKRAGTWKDRTRFLQPDTGKHSALGSAVILHRPGEMPYRVLTRKEFLSGIKKTAGRKKSGTAPRNG